MRYSLGLMGLAALAAASDVHDLTQDTFAPFIKENDLVLAEFYAPWCGHCKALAPEYEHAATELKEKNVALIKVDCTAEGELCKEYGVEGYPTLKIFRGAENVTPYNGQRKAPGIISYMTKQSMPAISELTTSTGLDEFKTADKIVIVGFFAADDKASNATFTEVGEGLRDDYLFGATSDAALAEAEGVVQPSIVLYKTFDEGKNTFTEKFVKDDIIAFTKKSSIPLIGEIGPETYTEYMAAGIPLAYIFAETAEERESLAKTLKPVAEEYKGRVNFATIDAGDFGQHAGNLNLEVGTWPAFAIQDVIKLQKYPFAEAGDAKDLSAKKIGKFLEDFVAGKIAPSIKSEPIPEKQEGPVIVVVADNYQDIVIDSKQDVLLEYYAPWCGHCKSLEPKYNELAGMYKDHADKIVIAKVDGTANDLPTDLAGFPTIKLFKAGSKGEPIDYSGDRSIKDLAKFIKENGSHGIDGYVAPEETESVETDGMPQQAAAATEGGVKGAVKEAVEVVKEALTGDEDLDEHDEL